MKRGYPDKDIEKAKRRALVGQHGMEVCTVCGNLKIGECMCKCPDCGFSNLFCFCDTHPPMKNVHVPPPKRATKLNFIKQVVLLVVKVSAMLYRIVTSKENPNK